MTSIRDAMRSRSNDYSEVEAAFLAQTGQDLCRVAPPAGDVGPLGVTLSVVIASYNGHRTLPATMAALCGQRATDFEIVIVDDGSEQPVADLFDPPDLPVRTRIVRIPRSRGLSVARNVGIQCAEGEALVFLDDDVLPPPTMTYALALRQAHTSQCLFLGFREDVDSDVFFDPGGRTPTADSDWRCSVRQGRSPGGPASGDETAEGSRPMGPFTFLGETRHFKAFGHGRKLGWSYLPTVVIGHSICAPRRDAVAAGGFVEGLFEGWGMEDTAFGAAMIAHGCFVVPALDWVSFHLRHEGRRVTRAEQREGNKRNAVTYERWIAEPAGGRPFPTHRVRRTTREGVFALDD